MRTVKVGILSLAALILGLCFSFVGIFVIDPSDNDGLFGNLAILASPAVVSTVVITLMINASSQGKKETYPKWFYFIIFGLFPLGYYGIFLGAALDNPEYFAPEDDGGLVTGSFLFLLMFGFAAISGYLIWFAVVFPCSMILKNIKDARSGKKIGLHNYVLPVSILVGTAFVLLAGGAVDADGVGKGAGVTILFAIFGLPGAYEVRSESLLWATRGIVLLVVLAYAGWRLLERNKAENAKASLK